MFSGDYPFKLMVFIEVCHAVSAMDHVLTEPQLQRDLHIVSMLASASVLYYSR